MILYHATSEANLKSIRENGILTSYATGKAKLVWLHDASMHSWAIEHVARRHQWDRGDVVILMVSVSATEVTRWSREGILKTAFDVPPENIMSVFRLVRQHVSRPLERQDVPPHAG